MIQVTQHKDQVYSKQEKDETYDYHSNLVLNNGILAGIQVGVGKRNHEDRDLQEAKLVEGLDLVEFRLYERLVSDEVWTHQKAEIYNTEILEQIDALDLSVGSRKNYQSREQKSS